MNPDDFAELFDANWSAVHRYVQRRAGPTAADDLAEEVFLVAWRRRSELPLQPLPWLYRTARHVVANHLRASGRAWRLVERTAGEAVGVVRDTADGVALRVDLSTALSSLPEPDREALFLVAWEELDVRQAAEAAGCRPATFRMRLHRARRRLRVALQGPTPAPPPVVAVPAWQPPRPEGEGTL